MRSKRVAALALAVLIATSVASAGPGPRRRARVATGYLVKHQNDDGSVPGFSPIGSTADAVLSFVAARRAPESIDAAFDYLESHEADINTVGLRAKVVLAAIAGGRDPRAFAGRNLVEEIKSTQVRNGRYGKGTAVFDHALAMIALAGAGEPSSGRAVDWLTSAQCPDGGWQYDRPNRRRENRHCFTGDADADPFRSDTNTTSLAVQALEAQTTIRVFLAKSPFRFFKKIRDPIKKGWGYSWGCCRLTDSNSTALVLQAYAAADHDVPRGGRRALNRLQYRLCGDAAGAFAFTWEDPDGDGRYSKTPPDVGATIGAVLGVLLQPLPLRSAEVTKPAPQPGPC